MPALFVAPAAATCALLAATNMPSVIPHPASVSYSPPPALLVILMVYLVALFLTLLLGAPIWAALYSYKIAYRPIFVVIGAVIGSAAYSVGGGLLSIYTAFPSVVPTIAAGAIGGWILHRIAYQVPKPAFRAQPTGCAVTTTEPSHTPIS